MIKYNRTKLKIHPKEGLNMETYSTPVIRGAIAFAIAFAIVALAVGICLLFATPFISAVRWW
ncbi:hypothetical protein [Haemophilus influenzae]|uniref:hypothetical protein n=1 Tax=Haemophilus influenzae TaxID=727 RepID=UPI000DD49D61|nr:hypothetical protein [Haemophilus influenzae]